ncbi:4-hydroxyphenylpyruvate dioxygenase [Burkholderia sp. MSh2]|uniref:4-hydroxyphenylpyruvate dioxygenase n=1 Tax=Burkholderia paludis TaxID=1506587 RepID=A0A6J5F4A3_9BURK|nr:MULTISPECIES: VOC family protein [Burkholderia]KEZ01259.1 4-hydroxyphenylpyruvate dioxygenase [Burkholderia sp. MSh2]KFG92757.1 4-hydroxyphenylpyruvate dioxygenase [Burkholderia paludis]CAB3773680.1 4-hydroxyphenylpyruvate dioxygenase [Burkholderia paludis]VWC17816.1 4-hydroxyphenylpyruvate dioxygenase [Burkholderia paludis]
MMEARAKTDGFAFVEFVSARPMELVGLFEHFGFRLYGKSKSGVFMMTQGAAVFLVNGNPNAFERRHGASVRAMGIRVDDANLAHAQALAGGALPASAVVEGEFVVDAPTILGIGDSLVYFVDTEFAGNFSMPVDARNGATVDANILAVDHTSNIVHPGNLDKWANFYRDTFGFAEKQYLEVKGHMSGMRARSMVSPCGRVSIPVAAAAHDRPGVLNQNDEFIRDYGGEGIQHIALLTSDIEDTIRKLAAAGIEFMAAPSRNYYAAIDARLPGHGLDVARLAESGLLVDGKGPTRILLQRFTKRQIGPVFFEIIERRGEDGFGEGNFKALFESQEQDQQRRGTLG